MFIFSNVKVVGLLGFLALSLSSAEVSASRLRGPHRRHLSKTKSNKGREKASKASNPDHYVLPVSGDAPSLEEERMFYYDEKPTSEISDTKKDKRDGLGVLEGHPQMKHNSEKTTKAEETSDTMSNQLGEWSNIDDPEDPAYSSHFETSEASPAMKIDPLKEVEPKPEAKQKPGNGSEFEESIEEKNMSTEERPALELEEDTSNNQQQQSYELPSDRTQADSSETFKNEKHDSELLPAEPFKAHKQSNGAEEGKETLGAVFFGVGGCVALAVASYWGYTRREQGCELKEKEFSFGGYSTDTDSSSANASQYQAKDPSSSCMSVDKLDEDNKDDDDSIEDPWDYKGFNKRSCYYSPVARKNKPREFDEGLAIPQNGKGVNGNSYVDARISKIVEGKVNFSSRGRSRKEEDNYSFSSDLVFEDQYDDVF